MGHIILCAIIVEGGNKETSWTAWGNISSFGYSQYQLIHTMQH